MCNGHKERTVSVSYNEAYWLSVGMMHEVCRNIFLSGGTVKLPGLYTTELPSMRHLLL